jgi:hypothetical protein
MKRMMIYAMVGVCTMGVGVVSAAEFANGPIGGAQTDPNERRVPSAGEFSNGPSGISK